MDPRMLPLGIWYNSKIGYPPRGRDQSKPRIIFHCHSHLDKPGKISVIIEIRQGTRDIYSTYLAQIKHDNYQNGPQCDFFFEVYDKVMLKRVCSTTETSQNIEILQTFLKLNYEGADQTAQMRRLVCTFVIHMQQKHIFS